MKNILLAVDDTKSSIRTIETMIDIFSSCLPEEVVLLHVQKIEGDSIMDELLLSDSEMETLKESLADTEYQEKLDQRSARVIDHFKDFLTQKGLSRIKPLVRKGHPAEEIIKAAEEEQVDMIVIGSRSKRLHNLFMGSVSREVSNKADVSVLLIK